MAGFAKGIVVAIIVTTATIILMNLAFFFPWYTTVIETAFEVSQIVANENYLPGDDYQNIYGELKSKPIFKRRAEPSKLYIEVTHDGGKDGKETVTGRTAEYYYNKDNKPYVQRGNQVTITIGAAYPFEMRFAGKDYTFADIPVKFSIKTTTLKYYKDLPYYTP